MVLLFPGAGRWREKLRCLCPILPGDAGFFAGTDPDTAGHGTAAKAKKGILAVLIPDGSRMHNGASRCRQRTDRTPGGQVMLTVVVRVNAPPDAAQSVKEALAMWLERYGDARVVSVTGDRPEQMRMEGMISG